MSMTLVEVEETSKKRKHEGDSKPAKKKRKQTDEAVETNVEEDLELVTKSSKKEKKRKEKQRVETGDAENSPNVEPPNTTRKEEKRKKRKDAEEPQPEAPREEESPVANAQQDEDMLDAPVTDQEEPDGIYESAPQDDVEHINETLLQSDMPTSFHAIRTSLYLPIPAIASSGQLSALLALHLSPLLLTYFPPVSGVILAYHDPVLSARPEAGLSKPLLPPTNGDALPEDQEEILARVGEEFGSSWAWLTATFLVFRPQRGDELTGWANAMSEGFIGLVSYNYFQTSIAKSRIPQSWKWSGPSKQQIKQRKTPRKGKLNDSDGPSQESYVDSQETVVAREDDAIDGIAGSFLDEDGNNVPDTLKFKVVDLEMIPAQERGQRFALQLEGTLLSEEEEREAREEERLKWENRQGKRVSRSRASTPGMPVMSGGLAALGRAGSIVSSP